MECKVTTVVTPNQFWVISNTADSSIKQLEIKIGNEIQSKASHHFSLDDYHNKLVAVEVEDKKYSRGSICEKGKDSSEVFLVDHGKFIIVKNSKLYPLLDSADAPKPLAFKVYLFGIFPTTTVTNSDGSKERRIANEWPADVTKKVSQLLMKNPDIIMKEVDKKNDVVYAEIIVQSNGIQCSLSNILEKNYNAIYVPSLMDKVVHSEKYLRGNSRMSALKSSLSSGMSSVSSDSEREKNTAKVNRWQEKNEEYKRREKASSSHVGKTKSFSSISSHSSDKDPPQSVVTDPESKEASSPSKASLSDRLSDISKPLPKADNLSPKKEKEAFPNSTASLSDRLSDISKPSLKADNVSSEKVGRGRALLNRLSRISNTSVKSEGSSSSDRLAELDQNSKNRESLSNLSLSSKSETGRNSSHRKPSKIELNFNKSEVDTSDPVNLFESDMPLKADDCASEKKSIFEELLKDDRSKKSENLNFHPAGKVTAYLRKRPFKSKAFMGNSPGTSESGRSQTSNSSRVKNVPPEVKPSKPSSLKGEFIRKPLTERNYAQSDVVRISKNRKNYSEMERKEIFYWPATHEGVLTETTNSKVPLDKPLLLATDTIGEIKPTEKINDLKISSSIIKNLQRHGQYKNCSSIQQYSINALMKNLNTVMISGPKTGKTLSYILAMVDFVQDKSNFDELPEGNGPYVVILCSSSKSAQDVYETCHKLLNNRSDRLRQISKVQIHLAHGGGAEKEVWVNLTNGCDILVSTPHCLARLIDCPLITNFERLCCLVIDEADIITNDTFRPQLLTILKLADDSTNSRSAMKSYQKVVCSDKWTPDIAELVKRTMEKDHVLIFANFLEAAIYARLKPHLSLVFGKEEKFQYLFDKIGNKLGKEKILIICEANKDVIMLKEKFEKELRRIPLIAHGDLENADIIDAANAWYDPKQKAVMICTDLVLYSLEIDDAEVLVHYSLPFRYKTNFGYRFSTLVKNYKNIQSKNKESKDLQVYCLIDENNHYQLPHLVEFTERLGKEIPEKIRSKCEEIIIKREIAKDSRPICFDMLEFGECKNFKSCPRRHAFNKVSDAPLKSQPTAGTVSFIPTVVHDAGYFSARLLELTDVNGVKTTFQNDYLMISLKLKQHFKKEENSELHGFPRVGDICAVKDEKNNYHRAQIIEYTKVDQHDNPTEVTIRLMDKGDILTKAKKDFFDLHQIPPELAEYPPQAVDIVLCGLLPMDYDSHWGRPSTVRARQLLIEKRPAENEKWVGRIVLSLNNILCLDPIELCEHLSVVDVTINKFSLGEKLIRDDLAVFNENHLNMLYKLCEKGGIPIPKYKQKKLEKSNIKPRWAFFDNFFEKVYFRNADDASTVFVVLAKFRDLVKNLDEDINAEAKKYLERKEKLKADIQLGTPCLAFYKEDQTWNRAIVVDKNPDWVKAFFVDYGDWDWVQPSDLLPISDRLIAKLPFQAIECSLIGIDHEIKPDDSKKEAILDAIYNFSTDGVDLLRANVMRNDLKPTSTGGKKYEINLLTIDGKSLSKKLVDENLVKPLESQRNHLTDIEIVLSEEEESDEEEIWEDEKDNSSIEKKEIIANEQISEENEQIVKNNDTKIRNEGNENKVEEYRLTDEQIEAMLDSDEEASNLFQTFASKTFPMAPKESINRLFGSQKKKAITEKEKDSDINADARKPPQNLKLFLQLRKQKKEAQQEIKEVKKVKITKIPLVVLPEGILSPDVYWIQNCQEVNLRIILTDVKDYFLKVMCNKILFSCNLNGKEYAVELQLFGSVFPQKTEVIVKAFYVELCLKKLTSEFWPRLVFDKIKHPNIHFDFERIDGYNKKRSQVDALMELAVKNVKSGNIMKPKKYIHCNPVDYSDSEDEKENPDDVDSDYDSDY